MIMRLGLIRSYKHLCFLCLDAIKSCFRRYPGLLLLYAGRVDIVNVRSFIKF